MASPVTISGMWELFGKGIGLKLFTPDFRQKFILKQTPSRRRAYLSFFILVIFCPLAQVL